MYRQPTGTGKPCNVCNQRNFHAELLSESAGRALVPREIYDPAARALGHEWPAEDEEPRAFRWRVPVKRSRGPRFTASLTMIHVHVLVPFTVQL